MRKRGGMGWRLMGAALAALALTGGMAARAAAQTSDTRPWLGVSTQEITDDLRDGLSYKGTGGVLVSRVVSDSPASRAGIKKGDVLVSLNSRTIDTPDELTDVVQACKVGQSVSLVLSRGGAKRTVTAKLVEWPADESDLYDAPTPPTPPSAPRAPRARSYHYSWDGDDFNFGPGMTVLRGRGRLGVQIQNLNGDLGEALGVPGGKGVLVTSVIDDTPAAKVGIKGGDVIVGVEGATIEDTDDLSRELRKHEGKTSITLMRRGAKRVVTPELEDRQTRYWYDGDRRHAITVVPDVRIKRDMSDDDRAELKKEMEALRQEMQEMKRQMEEDKATTKAPAPKKKS
jgi:predicted metalloprotease with PDZ domain